MVTKKDFDVLKNDIIVEMSKSFKDELENALAQVIDVMAKGFDTVNMRLNNVESRLNKVETRLDGVETQLVDVNERLDGVETGLVDVKRQLKDINMDTPTKAEFNNHEKRISNLENITAVA